MNNNKNIKNIADKCQIFTPENYVKELLDSVGYCKDIFCLLYTSDAADE